MLLFASEPLVHANCGSPPSSIHLPCLSIGDAGRDSPHDPEKRTMDERWLSGSTRNIELPDLEQGGIRDQPAHEPPSQAAGGTRG
jgi:hypothetical protein